MTTAATVETTARIREREAEQASLCTRLSRINAQLDTKRREARTVDGGTPEQRAELVALEGERSAVSGMLTQVEAELRDLRTDYEAEKHRLERLSLENTVRDEGEAWRSLDVSQRAVRHVLIALVDALLSQEARREAYNRDRATRRAAARKLAELDGLPVDAPQHSAAETRALASVLASLGVDASALDTIAPPTLPRLPQAPFGRDLATVRADFAADLERMAVPR